MILSIFLQIQINDKEFFYSTILLMLINPSISIAAESPVYVQNFIGSRL